MKSTNPGSSTARSRRADPKGDDTIEYQDSDEESPERRRKPRSASTSGSAGTRAGRTDRGNPSRSSTPRIPRNAAQMRTGRVAKPVIGKFVERQTLRSPSAPASLRPPVLPFFERQEPSSSSHGRHMTNETPVDSENDMVVQKEREKTRLAEHMLRHTEEEAERLILAVSENIVLKNRKRNRRLTEPWKNTGLGRRPR